MILNLAIVITILSKLRLSNKLSYGRQTGVYLLYLLTCMHACMYVCIYVCNL